MSGANEMTGSSHFTAAWIEVRAERLRLEKVHGDSSMASMSVGPWRKLAILMEEVGEVARNLNEQGKHGSVQAGDANLIEEVCQVSAASFAWLECLLRARDESRPKPEPAVFSCTIEDAASGLPIWFTEEAKRAARPPTVDAMPSGLPIWFSEAAERTGYVPVPMPFAFIEYPRTDATRAETLEAASAEAFREYQAKTGQGTRCMTDNHILSVGATDTYLSRPDADGGGE